MSFSLLSTFMILSVKYIILFFNFFNSVKKSVQKNSIRVLNNNLFFKGAMGTINDDIENSFVKIDLHGLSSKDSVAIFREFILPALSVLNKIILITGRGVHSKSGRLVLKEKVKKFLDSRGQKYDDVLGNEGAIYVYK